MLKSCDFCVKYQFGFANLKCEDWTPCPDRCFAAWLLQGSGTATPGKGVNSGFRAQELRWALQKRLNKQTKKNLKNCGIYVLKSVPWRSPWCLWFNCNKSCVIFCTFAMHSWYPQQLCKKMSSVVNRIISAHFCFCWQLMSLQGVTSAQDGLMESCLGSDVTNPTKVCHLWGASPHREMA